MKICKDCVYHNFKEAKSEDGFTCTHNDARDMVTGSALSCREARLKGPCGAQGALFASTLLDSATD